VLLILRDLGLDVDGSRRGRQRTHGITETNGDKDSDLPAKQGELLIGPNRKIVAWTRFRLAACDAIRPVGQVGAVPTSRQANVQSTSGSLRVGKSVSKGKPTILKSNVVMKVKESTSLTR
jgi:hypothetical protein